MPMVEELEQGNGENWSSGGRNEKGRFQPGHKGTGGRPRKSTVLAVVDSPSTDTAPMRTGDVGLPAGRSDAVGARTWEDRLAEVEGLVRRALRRSLATLSRAERLEKAEGSLPPEELKARAASLQARVSAARQVTTQIEQLGKLLGVLRSELAQVNVQVNFAESVEWKRLLGRMMYVLNRHPAAKAELLVALDSEGATGGYRDGRRAAGDG